jgi:hypothetical protein
VPRISAQFVDKPHDDLLRKLWQIRVEHLRLAKGEEADWQTFSGLFDDENSGVVVLVDEHREPQGFYSVTFIPASHEGKRALMILVKYWYTRKSARGGSAVIASAFKLIPTALRRYGMRRLFFVTTVYPLAFASLTHSFGNWYCLQEDIPEWERGLLTLFGSRYADFDSGLGVITGQAVPEEIGNPSAKAQERIAHYERLNPEWRTGRSLPTLFPVNGGTVRHALGRMWQRSRR